MLRGPMQFDSERRGATDAPSARTDRIKGTVRPLRTPAALLILTLLSVACTESPTEPFAEISRAAGIDFVHTDGSFGQYTIIETLASGVALFDYDLDGDLDIYFPNGRPLSKRPGGGVELTEAGKKAARNALYRNDGNLNFTDVTLEAGVPGLTFSIGACVGDYDGDGDLDLYVTDIGSNVLYRNEGNRRFTDATAEAGVADPRFSAGASFFDYDRDGDLDLYVTNYCDPQLSVAKPCKNLGVDGYCAPGQYPPSHDSLFENLGDGRFADVSESAGIRAAAKWGMGIVTTDLDDDGWIDIYVANDVADNFLFRNRRDGSFENISLAVGTALSAHGDEQGSMGVDVADYDGDGQLDIFVTNYHKQLDALYRNEGATYYDRAMARGLGESCLPMVSWGTKMFDYDHDGWLDIFIANGHLEDGIDQYDRSSTYRQRNQLFRNDGKGNFEDVTSESGPPFAELRSSRGAAFGDLDGDGDVDVVVCNSRETPSLVINQTAHENHWVTLELRGQKNVFAIGAKVRLNAGGRTQVSEVRSGGSYVSQNDLRLSFGLGKAQSVDRVEVRWPDGSQSSFGPLEVDRLHTLKQ